MSRSGYVSADAAGIRNAVLAIVTDAPIASRDLHRRMEQRTGLTIGERRYHRAVRWAIDAGHVRRVSAESWRDQPGIVRVVGRRPA